MRKQGALMQKRVCLKLFIVLLLGLISTTAYGQVIRKVSCDGKSYTLQFTCEKALLSRDGAEAVPVHSGTKITKPGTYYLSLFKPEGLVVETFTIKSQTATSYDVSYESDLVEIFKKAIENYQGEIILNFKYRMSINNASDILAKRLKETLTTYPMLICNGDRCHIYIQNQTCSRVTIKLNYPLKVVNTMKQYDTKAISGMTQMVNDVVDANMKDYQIEAALVKALLNKVSYSQHDNNAINATSLSHTLQGTFLDGKIVCDGYSKTLMYLLNMVGVPARMVEGSTTNQTQSNLGHAWNLVKLDGKYYHVDSTWADEYYESMGVLSYINELDDFISQTHIWDKKYYPKANTKTYSLPFSEEPLNRTYKVMDKDNYRNVLEQIKSDRPQSGSLIFYQQSKNNWIENNVMVSFYQKLGGGYSYYIEKKYDCLVVYFKYEV